ncbi:putative E3 ubiquitin protein ligase C167.07c [Labeo rohita]|uniref:E3 ubiquitin protein ligase C167.07c n=1 Tax=Labeo rohita TaxID=84645 RepID=A0ABQ8L4T1_LABRO|nr:putative E3 ubiquitin protein ligase C167.07c [Labeo rohita]
MDIRSFFSAPERKAKETEIIEGQVDQGQSDVQCQILSLQWDFSKTAKFNFMNSKKPPRRIPYASTCALTLYLPRRVSEEEEFKELMFTAIKGSLGFENVYV